MKTYKDNAKWLTWQAPFRVLSISSAYLAPFFLEKGLDLSQIFLLQSIFSLAYVLWELPSGYLADKIGRARSIQISAPIAAAAMVAYGFSGEFWQFVVCELLLALANGLLSGVDTALLTDSLKADKREHEFVRLRQRMEALGYAAVAFGVPVSFLLVQHVGISATLIADGVLIGIGALFGFRLVEAPRVSEDSSTEAVRLSAWHSIKQLSRNVEARWLVALGTSLATATYFAYWLSAPYYTSLGIPVVWFGALLAARSLWKAWLAHRFHGQANMTQKMTGYALTAGLVYAAMATQQIWLLWAVLGHDAVQALHRGPVTHQLNQHMAHEYRATLHSLVNLVQRLTYTVAGPIVGFMADHAGLPTTFAVSGAVCTTVALLAVSRLRRLRTFED